MLEIIMCRERIHRSLLKVAFMGLLLLSSSGQLMAQDGEVNTAKKADYVSLGKPMVLNLSSNRNRLSFLQLSADILVRSKDAKEIVENYIPVFRHILILKLSEQNAKDIKQPDKRELIRSEASKEMIQVLNKLADASDVHEVLFSQFLVQ